MAIVDKYRCHITKSPLKFSVILREDTATVDIIPNYLC